MLERELKAVVPEPDLVRERLLQAGAQSGFRGLMIDRRYDRDGVLLARDEVLRLREFHHPDGAVETRLSWKGPTGVTSEGYKSRRELEYQIRGRGQAQPSRLLEALGFREFQRIERKVEYFNLASAEIRLEWYPRMDVLIEVEGDPEGIEAVLPVIGLPRSSYSAEPLPIFAARFAARTGAPAALSLDPLGPAPPGWKDR